MKMERGYPTYTVTPKAEAAIVKGHPWVYDAEILNTEGETANGGLVDVVSRRAGIWAPAFSPSDSKIRVRLISRNANDRFDEAFWRAEAAMGLGLPQDRVMDSGGLWTPAGSFSAEADAFPGLTVDKFHDLPQRPGAVRGHGARCRTSCCPLWWTFCRRTRQPIRGVYLRNDVRPAGKGGLPQSRGWYSCPASRRRTAPVTEIDGKRRQVSGGRGKRAEDRLLPGPEVQPPGGGHVWRGQDWCWTASPTPAPSL
ncbi:MAG: hypothetical protein ACLU38_10590 [Dysosmobacter sp.]